MATAEILAALARECPNGVSFDSMAVRLLRQKVPFEDCQIEELKSAMFQLGSGLWFSREMIADDESRFAFEEPAMKWLLEYGCFSVERLFRDTFGFSRHIVTPEDCATFLRNLGFTVAVWGKGGYFCSQPPPSLDDILATISKTIAGWLEEAGGTLTFHEIEQELPHLSGEALESIRLRLLPELHETEVGGVLCWCSTEAIPLPEDFSEKLTTVADTLVALEERLSVANLEFALNLLYRVRFRKEYSLPDNVTFMRVCAKHYLGKNDVFPNSKKPRVRAKALSVSCRRVRGPNTRFKSLDVPIGAELFFIKDRNVVCTVIDDSNQVEYAGKSWAISALAGHLLGWAAANGFEYFSFDGEILWNRRLRLEQEGKHKKPLAQEIPPPPTLAQEAGNKIIYLGHPLSPSTWRRFRADGTNPRVAEWVLRIKNGEGVEQIALESGHAVSTMKTMISNFHLYFELCRLNGIVPEGAAGV